MKGQIGPTVKQIWLLSDLYCLYNFGSFKIQQRTTWTEISLHLFLLKNSMLKMVCQCRHLQGL